MRTNLEFRSSALLADTPEDAPQGETTARFLAERLPAHGFEIEKVHAEDWGWRIHIHHEAFPLWIGCGFYPEYPDGVLCFIEPAKPFLRRWFRKICAGGARMRTRGAKAQAPRRIFTTCSRWPFITSWPQSAS
jgi:hypothetical protein